MRRFDVWAARDIVPKHGQVLRMVDLRRATLKDRKGLHHVQTRAILETCRAGYALEQVQAWASFLRPDDYTDAIHSREFIVARDKRAVVGFGQLDVTRGHIEAVYVLPACQRRGIGSAILAHLEAAARKAGRRKLTLSSTMNALPFYKHAGFVELRPGERRLPNGMSLPCLDMEKDLTEDSDTQRTPA